MYIYIYTNVYIYRCIYIYIHIYIYIYIDRVSEGGRVRGAEGKERMRGSGREGE